MDQILYYYIFSAGCCCGAENSYDTTTTLLIIFVALEVEFETMQSFSSSDLPKLENQTSYAPKLNGKAPN